MTRLWRCLLPTLLLLGAAARAEAQAPHLLFVENSQSADVSVIDGTSLKVIGTIQVGASPDDIIPSPSGDVLYLSRIVRRSDGRPTGTGEVVAIDPIARTVLWRVGFPGAPNHLAVSPDGRRVYATIVSGNWVDIIDPAAHRLVDSVEVGPGPHDIEVTPDGAHVFVGLIRGTEVVEFDASTHRVLQRIGFDDNVRPIAVSKDERRIYVQLSHHHSLAVADLQTGKVSDSILMPVPPGHLFPRVLPTDVNHGLRITPDGKTLIANGSIVDLVAIWSLPGLKLLGTVPVGRDPNWVTLSPDARRAYVSNRGSDDVSVIDLRTRREVARIKVGSYPQRMATIALPGH